MPACWIYLLNIAAGRGKKYQSFRLMRFVNNTWLGENMETVESLFWALGGGGVQCAEFQILTHTYGRPAYDPSNPSILHQTH
jgi:hypothetical protein